MFQDVLDGLVCTLWGPVDGVGWVHIKLLNGDPGDVLDLGVISAEDFNFVVKVSYCGIVGC